MKRFIVGVLLLLHGLAHAFPGMIATDSGQSWLFTAYGVGEWPVRWMATLFWAVAMVGFAAAGFGRLGVRPLDRWWPKLMLGAGVGSILLFTLFPPGVLAVPGVVIDVMIYMIWINRPAPHPHFAPHHPLPPRPVPVPQLAEVGR